MKWLGIAVVLQERVTEGVSLRNKREQTESASALYPQKPKVFLTGAFAAVCRPPTTQLTQRLGSFLRENFPLCVVQCFPDAGLNS